MIESAKYNFRGSIVVVIDGQEMLVPNNIENRHRIMIAEWEDSGNVIDPYIAPEPTPEELRAQMLNKSMVEFRATLRSIRTEAVPNGIYAADIEAKISEIVDLDLQEEARDYFNLGQYAERLNPWIDILGAMFGLSPQEIDVLWTS